MNQKIRYEFFFTHHPAFYINIGLETLAINALHEMQAHFPTASWTERPDANPSQFPEDVTQLSSVIIEGELTGEVDWNAAKKFLNKACENRKIGWRDTPLYNPSSMSRSTL